MNDDDAGPIEKEVNRILKFHVGAAPAIQRAFKEGRNPELADFTGPDQLPETLLFLIRQNTGLREVLIFLAHELDKEP